MAAVPETRKQRQRSAVAADGIWLQVTPTICQRLHQFMLDGRTGNVLLHIRDGEVLKATLEEHVKG